MLDGCPYFVRASAAEISPYTPLTSLTHFVFPKKNYTFTFAKNNCTKLAKQLYQTTHNQRQNASFNCTKPGPEFPEKLTSQIPKPCIYGFVLLQCLNCGTCHI